MDEHNLTVFYMKNSGNIYGIWGGTKDFNVFGEDKDSMAQVMEYLVVKQGEMPMDISSVKVDQGIFVMKERS